MKLSVEIILIIIIGIIILFNACSETEYFSNVTGTTIAGADIDAIRNLNSYAKTLMQPDGTLTNPGNLNVAGNITMDSVLGSNGTLHIHPAKNLYLLPKDGSVMISKDWGASGNLLVGGDLTAAGNLSIPGYNNIKGTLDSFKGTLDSLTARLNKIDNDREGEFIVKNLHAVNTIRAGNVVLGAGYNFASPGNNQLRIYTPCGGFYDYNCINYGVGKT